MVSSRSGLSDQVALKDPFLPYNYDLVIPNIPGGGDAKGLTVKCASSNIPGYQLEEALVQLHGAETRYAGRGFWTHDLTATFLELRDISTRETINNWLFFCRDPRNNSGNYKAQYATIADMKLYDDQGNTSRTIRMFGFFPRVLDDAPVEGNNSTPVMLSVTFSYDYWQDQ